MGYNPFNPKYLNYPQYPQGISSMPPFVNGNTPTSQPTFFLGERVGTVYGEGTIKGISTGVYVIARDDGGTSFVSDNEMTKTKKLVKEKEIKLDLTKLEPLVIDPSVKEEIVAVLKQHNHAKKMFETWGLGEVIEYGRGMTFLFYGTPGTGKTWAANCIAKALDLELVVVGAAEIQSSEPGGANRNIQNAFKSSKKKVLLLDECDSLITSRNDVGMIIGSEINTLLTEIEKSEGMVILATNRIDTLDEALERRISLIVEFPKPTFPQREAIWEKMLPKKMPIGEGVGKTKLAENVLTGGQIKNVIMQAARLALSGDAEKVELSHFEAAIQRVLKSRSLMGQSSRYRQVEDYRIG